ncbi:MAG TPA: hypothetical protein VEI02_08845, partial [Planctomycetota bacterium]|nr:hypothetical protein [Planctomycetota bacterium]
MSLARCALSLSFAVALATGAFAQIPYELVGTSAPATAASWNAGPAFVATDMEPLAFAVRSSSATTGARVALFVRAVAPMETIELLDQTYPGHGIDLYPTDGPFTPTSPNATFVLEG